MFTLAVILLLFGKQQNTFNYTVNFEKVSKMFEMLENINCKDPKENAYRTI